MKNKILTMDDLVKFCQEQNFTSFSSKDSGYRLCVQVPSTFEVHKFEDSSRQDLMTLKIKVLHTLLNRNKSFVSKKSAKDAAPSLAGRPILAYIHQLEDGTWDFEGHNISEEKNEDGEYEYLERQVGSFTYDKPWFERDEEDPEKEFLCAYAVIPTEYTRAAEIIENKGGTKTSSELSIEEMSYDAKEGHLNLEKFYVSGLTLLGSHSNGEEIQEGMKGSRADIVDFSEKNNATFTSELLDELKKFNKNFETLQFSNEGKEEKPMEEKKTEGFEEEGLKEEVEETTTEDTFEEETSEETAVENEEFSETGEEETPSEEENEVNTEDFEEGTESEETEEEVENTESEEESDEDEEETEEADKYSLTCPDGTVKEFSLSMTDIQMALSEIVNDTYGELDNDYYGIEVYPDDKKLVMCGWFSGQAYRQAYKRKKDTFSLDGERISVHSIWVSEDEEKALEDAKANFAEVSEKLAKYEAEPEKVEILESEEYANIAETEEFAELKKQDNHFDLSVDEVKAKADEMLLTYAKGHQLNFTATEQPKKKVAMKGLLGGTSNRKGRYGNLFSK